MNSRKKILIVDDSEMNRALLSDMLSNQFEILEAENGKKAVAILKKQGPEIALMLLDIVMPVMDGFEVLTLMNKNNWIKTIPVIIISSETVSAYVDRAYDLGALEYISRPFDERTVQHRVVSTIMLTGKQRDLSNMLAEQMYEKEKTSRMMIEILSNLVEFRNGESGLHVLHIQTLTELFLEHLLKKTDRYVISDQDRHLICNAAALHDIGKMAVPEEILNKPGRLTKEEFEIMKTHTVEGAKILEEIPNWKMEPLIQYAHQICRWHHERYDGSGYPDGLVGESIPIAAQIVALADVYDALTSRRVYKPAYSHEKAIEMIINGECGVFNPLLLECLTDMADYLEEALQKKYNEIHTEKAIRKTVDQMLASRNLEPSDRTLRLLEREKLKYQFLADASREILFEYTVEPEMVLISGGGARELGMPESFLDPKESSFGMEMFRHEDFQRFLEEMRNTTPESPAYEGDYLLNIRGHKRWCKVMACSMWEVGDNAIQYEGAVGKITDIHDATEMIHHLEKIAVLDSLTGLLNPKAAKLQISTILSAHPDKTYAFMMLDLDNFKMANDQHGHLFGDQVLKQVANAFEQNMASADIASRIGDEFLFFFQYEDNVEEKVDRLFQEISIDFNGYPIRASVGVALSKDCNGDYESLFRMADTAMYAAKHYGKNNYQFYRDDMKEQFASISQGSALDWTN